MWTRRQCRPIGLLHYTNDELIWNGAGAWRARAYKGGVWGLAQAVSILGTEPLIRGKVPPPKLKAFWQLFTIFPLKLFIFLNIQMPLQREILAVCICLGLWLKGAWPDCPFPYASHSEDFLVSAGAADFRTA